ncbi:MAG: MgPME-cyclase complex family protein [Microcystis panniformis]
MTTYYYLVASQKFLEEEAIEKEVLKERIRNYQEKGQEIDFWLITNPAFLDTPAFADIKKKTPQPASAIVSLNQQFITWLKLRLEYVITGQFEAPSDTIPEPLK